MSASPWSEFVREFLEGYFEQYPTFAASVGRHDYDGRLPDWSRQAFAEKVVWLREQRARAAAFAGLEGRPALEREHVLAQLDADLFWIAEAGWQWRNPLFYTAPLDPNLYVTREYAPLERRLRAYVDYARGVPRAAEQIRANLRTPMPPTYAQVGRLTLGGLADYYANDVPPIFAAVGDPELQMELRAASKAAAAAMRDLGAWFARQEEAVAAEGDGAGGGFALGSDLFQRMLHDTERVDVPLADLAAAGRRDLERNLAALRAACAAYAPGRPLEECVAAVQAEKPDGGPIEGARRQLAGLRRFVEEHALV